MSDVQSFWDHLDELRSSLIRVIISVVLCSIVAFCFKVSIFDVILAPQQSDFITYRLLEKLSFVFSGDSSSVSLAPIVVRLINTGLAQQFLIHVKISLTVGFIAALPYIIYLLFGFISPALYIHEKRYAKQLVIWGYLMFILGTLLSYFLIFPLTFRFLGMYQVSDIVENTVTIESYINTLLTISVCMGIVFEIPVVCWIMGRLGLLNANMMRKYRRHVIVVLLIIGAIITPTADVFTLLLVSLPMWMLYEVSILIVGAGKRTYKIE